MHSDQGSPYQSTEFRLEVELLGDLSIEDEPEVRLVIGSWIDQLYNPRRLHLGLGYCCPIEFEQRSLYNNPPSI